MFPISLAYFPTRAQWSLGAADKCAGNRAVFPMDEFG
jgi:hypothetical protein